MLGFTEVTEVWNYRVRQMQLQVLRVDQPDFAVAHRLDLAEACTGSMPCWLVRSDHEMW